jgi:hypothetical protein
MKGILFWLVAAFSLVTVPMNAQDENVAKPRFTEERLDQTERSLVAALESSSPDMQATASQTIRDLKAMFPDRSFSRLVIPLMRIVKNETAQSCNRTLAALALHALHSDMGDFAISQEAKFSDCKRMRHLCGWLTYYRLIGQKPELANTPGGATVVSR